MPAHNAVDGSKADAGAFKFLRAVQSLKYAKELVGVFHIEADAVVANENGGLAIGLETTHFDHRLGARARVFDGVGKEVGEDLFEKASVALHCRQGLEAPLDAAAFCFTLEVGEHLSDESRKRSGLAVQFLPAKAGEIQKILD